MTSFFFDKPEVPAAYYRALDAALAQAEVAVCAIDLKQPELPIFHANAVFCKLFPQPEGGPPRGVPLAHWFPKHAWLPDLTAAARAGKQWSAPEPLTLEDAQLSFEVSLMPDVPPEAGKPPRYALVLLRDIAAVWQDVRLERERERQRVMMESFGTICHAIGQPMTVLLSSVEMMRLNLVDEKGRQEMVEMCYESALEIRDLLQQLNEKRHYATEQYRKSATHADDIVALREATAAAMPDGLSEAVENALSGNAAGEGQPPSAESLFDL